MSFGESIFSTGFIQKTIKEDQHVRGNHEIPPRVLCGKTLENSRRLSTEAHPKGLPCGTNRSVGSPRQPLVAMSVSHRFLGCISVVA
jgi:hypothetical protein